jgi:hypothetical protein
MFTIVFLILFLIFFTMIAFKCTSCSEHYSYLGCETPCFPLVGQPHRDQIFLDECQLRKLENRSNGTIYDPFPNNTFNKMNNYSQWSPYLDTSNHFTGYVFYNNVY